MNPNLENLARSTRGAYEEAILPLEKRFSFEKGPDESEMAGGPLVLLVGNHSSGKSTFINFILGEEVQNTGMAPTDDRFTVLRYGERREERDGPAVVSNPDLPFTSLRQLGPDFIAHFRMKLLPNPILRDLSIVDTPGMIDAAEPNHGRGYQFEAAVQWFADRADVVLIFFDPERPGTTAETLTTLTGSLSHIEHKLLVVMNKMDQFRSLPDFARCYGTLCWNLGKVIEKKDIPPIFTTYVPVPGAPESVLPLEDFDKARGQLIEEIARAPYRRVENMITLTTQHAENLRMHVRIVDRAKSWLGKVRRAYVINFVLMLVAGLTASVYYFRIESFETAGAILVATLLAALLGTKIISLLMRRRERRILRDIDVVFEEVYKHNLVVENRPESLIRRWEIVRPITRRIVGNLGFSSLPRLKSRELAQLDHCIEETLPELRAGLHRPTPEGSRISSAFAALGFGRRPKQHRPEPRPAPDETREPAPAQPAPAEPGKD